MTRAFTLKNLNASDCGKTGGSKQNAFFIPVANFSLQKLSKLFRQLYFNWPKRYSK